MYQHVDQVMEEEANRLSLAVNRMSTLEPHNFLKKKTASNKPVRSLEALTGDEDIFKMLHVAFVWILKACGSRMTETILEGPPVEENMFGMKNNEGHYIITYFKCLYLGILCLYLKVSWIFLPLY